MPTQGNNLLYWGNLSDPFSQLLLIIIQQLAALDESKVAYIHTASCGFPRRGVHTVTSHACGRNVMQD